MSCWALIRSIAAVVAVGVAAGCTSKAPSVDASQVAVELDSIVLERGPCFGFCPMYRLVLDASGRIRYRNRGEDLVHTDSVAPGAVARLVARAEETGFFRLPERIMGDSALCSMVATDHPGVIVSIFGGGTSKTVDHYTGCNVEGRESPGPAPAIVRLIALEQAIDSTARVERWRRPRGPR